MAIWLKISHFKTEILFNYSSRNIKSFLLMSSTKTHRVWMVAQRNLTFTERSVTVLTPSSFLCKDILSFITAA